MDIELAGRLFLNLEHLTLNYMYYLFKEITDKEDEIT